MLNKIRAMITSASTPHGKKTAVDELKDEAAKLRAEWDGTAAQEPTPVDPYDPYASPFNQTAQQNALQQQVAHMQAHQVYLTTGGVQSQIVAIGAGGGNHGGGGSGYISAVGGGVGAGAGQYATATQIYGGAGGGYFRPPDKFDHDWRVQYAAAREEAATARMVEET